MSMVMDAGYANAKLRNSIEASFCLVNSFRAHLTKDARGRYKRLQLQGFKEMIFDVVLIDIFMAVSRKENGTKWLEREKNGRYLVRTKAMEDAIDLYMKKKKLKKFTKEVIMD